VKLLGVDDIGGRVEKHWLHVGDDGKDRITVETIQHVDPIFRHVKNQSEAQSAKSDFRYQGSIPATLIEEIAKTAGALWGNGTLKAFQEIMLSKTDRAKKIWKMLLKDRDYRKLQANGS